MLDIKRQTNQRCEECCGALMGMECKAGDRVVGKSDKSEIGLVGRLRARARESDFGSSPSSAAY